MANDLDAGEVRQRLKADALLDQQGLRGLLGEFGHVETTGSYLMQCMARPELELFLEVTAVLEGTFFALGGRLATQLSPLTMTYRNGRLGGGRHQPRGLEWQVFLGETESPSAWRIRITALERYEYQDRMGYLIQLHDRMSPAHRLHILSILHAFARRTDRTIGIPDSEVWNAVIDRGVTDYEGFCALKGIPFHS